MKSSVRMIFLALLIPVLQGCSFTAGPKIENQVVFIKPGNPVQVMENKNVTVKIQPITDKSAPIVATEINLGGSLIIRDYDWDVFRGRLLNYGWIEKNYPDIAKLAKEQMSGNTTPKIVDEKPATEIKRL